MPVSLSIKGVPDALVERLRRRAASNHRSLQRELMALIEAAVQQQTRVQRAAAVALSQPSAALTFAESEAAWQVDAEGADDGLLAELDGIVAGSRWGEAPLLTREQAHDRALAREIDFDARRSEAAASPQPRKGGAA